MRSFEKTQLNLENKTPVEETKRILEEEEEEDIIIKCGLEEMVRVFFEDFRIVWHDPKMDSEENKQYIAQLERFCEVKTFTEWEKASTEIQKTKAFCHVITSGTNGKLLVKEISQSQRVSAIYVFCRDKENHEEWAKSYEKVSCVETQIQNILDQIQQNLIKWSQEASSLKTNLPAFVPIFNDWDKSKINALHCYLKTIPNFENRSQAKTDFVNLSKVIYSNQDDANLIALFEKNYNEYHKETILYWYTQESFLFKVTNNCLRIASSDSIQYCRLLLKDLERAIKNQYKEKSHKFNGLLFRGAYLSDKEWSSLKANINREIEMHGFLSASKEKKQALKFTQSDPSKKVFITIIVPKGPCKSKQGFAEVEEFSNFPMEKEVLFNVSSRFTVLEAEDEYSKDLPYRHLVLLYGAQDFRKYITEKSPVQEVSIPSVKTISCFICEEEDAPNLLFKPLGTKQAWIYLCKECIPDFLEDNNAPLLWIPPVRDLTKPLKIQLQGIVMKFPKELRISMYGYQCYECQAKKQAMYFQCTECQSETKKAWCENCIEKEGSCLKKGHNLILESIPFGFWSDRMSQKELDHFEFQKGKGDQAWMYLETHEYKKENEYCNIYIKRNSDKEDFKLATAFLHLGRVSCHQAEYKKAEEYCIKCLEILESFNGEDEEYEEDKEDERYEADERDIQLCVMECYNHLGQVYFCQSDHKKALASYSQGLEVLQSFGEDSPQISNFYTSMGQVYSHLGQHNKALEYYFEALEIKKIFYTENHPSVALGYNDIAIVYMSQAKYNEALEYYLKALEILKLYLGENHPQVAICFNNMAMLHYHQAEFKKAVEYYTKALEILKPVHGESHPDIAMCYNNMALLFKSQGKHNKALEYYLKALEINKSFNENGHPETTNSYHNMAIVYSHQGEYKKALEYWDKASEINKLYFGENHLEIAFFLHHMATTFHRQADYDKALEHFNKALWIYREFYGENHLRIAESLLWTGKTYFVLGDHSKALEYFFRALDMKKLFLENDNHPEFAWIYCNIGDAFHSLGEHDQALDFLSQSLGIQKSVFCEDDHSDMADTYSGFGRVYLGLKQHEKALEYHFMSLEIRRSMFTENHADVAASYCDIADVFKNKGEHEMGLEYYSKALEIRKGIFGEDHVFVIAVSEQIRALPGI